ncbi:vps52p [Saccharomyces arboricola H-6]|uniref:Vps52p n=1 Tax=Saccharomyces arboricola (strain H-6 / AS 2.3317 / CBS 10644) TaxID=1160507 RepID=J8Q3L6_SACAR|nr:vps52p [Saccharomyces arboricola H-6]
MDVLRDVLSLNQTNFDQLAATTQNEVDNNDLFESYLKDCKFKPSSNQDQSPLMRLKTLQEMHSNNETAISVVIPQLIDYLTQFTDRLSNYTQDLDFIKRKSNELQSLLEYNSTKLANISPMVNDLMIPPELINDIIKGKINESWQDNITFIADKEQIYDKYRHNNHHQSNNKTGKSAVIAPKDFDNLCQLLDVLKNVILERSKRLIISKIKTLRSSHPVPSQRLQTQLLKVQKIFPFIRDNNLSLALELRQAYCYTMKWYYKEYFSRYIRSLTILPFQQIDSQFALGNGLSTTSVGGFSNSSSLFFSSYLTTSATNAFYNKAPVTDEEIDKYFQIKKRLNILTQEDNTVMVSQIAENNTAKNYIEIGFKNLNLAILDNCTVEYRFLRDFFAVNDESSEEINGLLEQIFQPTFDEATAYTQQLIQYNYDIFGILISIRVANQLQFESERRGIPSMFDSFLNGQLIQLWPRFQQLVDFQCESLRKVAITTNTAKYSGSSATNGSPLTSPHELAVQFGKFLISFLTLAITHKLVIDERSEPLYNSIIRLRNDFETVMTKCSKKTKSPERFLTTNYMYLYNILQQLHLHLNISDSDAQNYNPDSTEGANTETTDDDENDSGIPLIIRETENHFKTLVEAFTRN